MNNFFSENCLFESIKNGQQNNLPIFRAVIESLFLAFSPKFPVKVFFGGRGGLYQVHLVFIQGIQLHIVCRATFVASSLPFGPSRAPSGFCWHALRSIPGGTGPWTDESTSADDSTAMDSLDSTVFDSVSGRRGFGHWVCRLGWYHTHGSSSGVVVLSQVDLNPLPNYTPCVLFLLFFFRPKSKVQGGYYIYLVFTPKTVKVQRKSEVGKRPKKLCHRPELRKNEHLLCISPRNCLSNKMREGEDGLLRHLASTCTKSFVGINTLVEVGPSGGGFSGFCSVNEFAHLWVDIF